MKVKSLLNIICDLNEKDVEEWCISLICKFVWQFQYYNTICTNKRRQKKIDKNKNVKKQTILLYHNWINNQLKGSNVHKFVLCIEVCVCMSKQEYFLPRICMCADICMSKSLNQLVIQAHSWRVDVFERVIFVSSMSAYMSLPLHWTKKFLVLILFEWIELRYF